MALSAAHNYSENRLLWKTMWIKVLEEEEDRRARGSLYIQRTLMVCGTACA